MRRTSKEHRKTLYFILEMLIDILNLGEQIGIYWAQKSLGLTDDQERFVFYIFIAINSGEMFKVIAPNDAVGVVISVLIEIAEVIGYLFGLPRRTNTTLAVALVFFFLELILHIIYFSFEVHDMCCKENETNNDKQKKDKNESKTEKVGRYCIAFSLQLAIFAATVVTPILSLFVDSSSLFRQNFYEMFLIFTLFFHGQLNTLFSDIKFEPFIQFMSNTGICPFQCGKTVTMVEACFFSESNKWKRRWAKINLIIYMLLVMFIMPLIWVILASLEFRNNGQNLPSYDRGLYIYMLVSGGITLSMSPCCLPCCLIPILAYECYKYCRKCLNKFIPEYQPIHQQNTHLQQTNQVNNGEMANRIGHYPPSNYFNH